MSLCTAIPLRTCTAQLTSTGSRCQWTLNLWRLLVLKFGSHEIELGDRHIEITKKEGVVGTMLQMPRLQQEERFAMPLVCLHQPLDGKAVLSISML